MNIKRYFVVAALASILVLPIVSFAQSTAEIQVKIEALLAQIKQLQARLDALQKTQTQWCHTFNTNLRVGDQNDEVTNLDRALIKEGFLNSDEVFQDARTVLNFDEITAAAVTGFQEKYKSEILTPSGLARGTGYVGPATRKKLNQLYGCGVIKPIACTQDAKQCPDGSYVSRTGPKCEFAACPVVDTTAPIITSLSNSSGSIGSKLEVHGRNLSGFEGDTNAWIENSRGAKGLLSGESGSNANLIKVTLNSPLCQEDNSYSGKPCSAWLNLTPGVYKIYTMPWGKKSNVVPFSIVAATSQSTIKVLSPNGGEAWSLNSRNQIRWEGGSDLVTIELLEPEDAPGNYGVDGYIVQNASNSRSIWWSVGRVSYIPIGSNIAQTTLVSGAKAYKIRIRDNAGHTDESDAPFSIVAQ